VGTLSDIDNPALSPGDKAKILNRHIRAATLRRLQSDRVRFIRELTAGKRVLDLGCVDHAVTNQARRDWLHGHIKESAAELVGMDYEEAEIGKLREQGFDVVAGDATDFDLGRTFDIVVAGEFLEHLLNPLGFLNSVRKHLEPGGQLVLTVPNGNSLNYFVQNLFFGYETDGYDHVAFYTPLTLFNLLRKAGYELVSLAYLFPDTSFHHRSLLARVVVKLHRFLQYPICLLRPSLSRQIAVVATPSSFP
jgi:SAM-dependent methyltransferase